MNNKNDFYYKELEILRNELDNLKRCQLQYFTLSITSTGIILTIVAKFSDFSSILFLLPLTILIPTWFVFFDKAKTITRIVAYYRLLESSLLNNIFLNLPGWENSLIISREWESISKNFENLKVPKNFPCETINEKTRRERIISFFKPEENPEKSLWERTVSFIKPHVANYWFIMECTFLSLILLCIILSTFYPVLNPSKSIVFSFWVIIGSLVIFGLATLLNARTYLSLIKDGKHSYNTNMKIWCEIFNIDYCKYRGILNKCLKFSNLFTNEFMKEYTTFKDFSLMLNKSNLSDKERKFLDEPMSDELDLQLDLIRENKSFEKLIESETSFKDFDMFYQKANIQFLRKIK